MRDLAARYCAELVARCDPLLRGPDQLDALHALGAEYDNVLVALRHLCDTGDADGAIRLTVDLSWYWLMIGRQSDAVHWLGEALAVPVERPSVQRAIAEGMLLVNSIAYQGALVSDAIPERDAELRVLTDRLLSLPELPGIGGTLIAVRLAALPRTAAPPTIIQRLIDGPDVWLAGLAHLFRAQAGENEGHLDQVGNDVTAALACFARAGDRWGLASALPLRALLRQYTGDLGGALVDLTEAKRLAREFGSLGLSDEIFIDLCLIDLHVRLDDTARAAEMIAATRERALRSASPEMAILLDGREAGRLVRIGDLERARELVESVEARLSEQLPRGDDHGQALVRAYAAAVESRDMPILATVAVAVARLAALYGQYRDVAVLLGAASRLRGAHDRTDRQVHELTRSGQAALGEEAFATAYDQGWQLDGKAAATEVDPARLRRDRH